jgi:hypothetical protein
MNARRVAVAATALVVLGASTAILVATAVAWAPCASGLYSEACLRAMDQPTNSNTVANGWILALIVCLVPTVLSVRASSRLRPALMIGAFSLVLVGNPMLDYAVSYGYWPRDDLWDAAPGMGYLTAAAIAIAGLMLFWQAASRAERQAVVSASVRAADAAVR